MLHPMRKSAEVLVRWLYVVNQSKEISPKNKEGSDVVR